MGDDHRLFIAVDLGAGSGRVFLAGFAPQELMLEEVRRFHYPPRCVDGHLRWDARQILAEITTGLREAADRARALHRPVHSLGIDCWGVDYGLVDGVGRLVEDPVCYRDARTDGMMDAAFERVPRAEMFARTGIQFMPLNTDLPVVRARARRPAPSGEAPAAGARPRGSDALRPRHHRVLHRHHDPDVQRVHRHLGRRAARAPGHPSGPALRGGPVGHLARSPPSGGGRRDGPERRPPRGPGRPRHRKRRGGRAAAARLGVHLLGHLVPRRRRAAVRPHQR